MQDRPPASGTDRTRQQPPAAHTSPGWGPPPPPPPPRQDSSFRDFVRQKPAQIIGAGLIGLVIGGLLGGTAVALVAGVTHHDRASHWDDRPRWGPYRDWERHPGVHPNCRPVPGGTYCRDAAPFPPGPTAPMIPPTPVPTMSLPPTSPPTAPPPITPTPTRTG